MNYLDIKKARVTELLTKHGISPPFPSWIGREYADRGTMIHDEIENYIKTGEFGFTVELQQFIKFTKELDLREFHPELVVQNDLVKGRLDLLAGSPEYIYLIDYKTGNTVNEYAWRWQLSLYKYLYGMRVDKMLVFHLGDDPKIIELEEIPQVAIEALLECERNGTIYVETAMQEQDVLLARLYEVENTIARIDAQSKHYKKQAEEMKEALRLEMVKQNVKSYETERLKITYIAPSERVSVDSKKLKEEMPEVWEQYSRVSTVKDSVRITLRSTNDAL